MPLSISLNFSAPIILLFRHCIFVLSSLHSLQQNRFDWIFINSLCSKSERTCTLYNFPDQASNQITSIRSLRKVYFSQLNELDICKNIVKKAQNPILDPQYLSELYLDKIKLLNIEKWVNQSLIGHSKRWCLRLQVPPNRKIRINLNIQ
jgi:hypothetical protein